MFLKNHKIFLIKNFYKSLKDTSGSIAVLVLIVAIAMVIALTSLSAYLIKDIKFTQLDEQKLIALNIAEAGLSDMYANLYKYYNGDIANLPSSPYEGELKDGTEVLGTYLIEYAPYYDGDILSGYIINSKGVDLSSQTERKIGVRVSILQQASALGIYDFIYTGQSATFGPNGNVIDGPFYTEGNLSITNGAGMLQSYSSGPVVIKGNLLMDGDTVSLTSESLSIGGNVTLEGSAKIKGGPVSIAGSLLMDGGTLIGNPLVSPMIVMGDITMSGSAQIGMPSESLILSCPGVVSNPPWAPIYATRDDSLSYSFTDPQFNVIDLVDTYVADVSSSALIISGNLVLRDTVGFSYSNSSGANSISFSKAADNKWVLNINGNVIINGSLTIGGTSWWPLSTNEIYYTGKGVIYTSLDMISYAKLIPLPTFPERSYPEDDLLALVSEKNITFDIFNFWDSPDCSSANIFIIAIAKENISLVDGTLKGTALAGGSLLVNKDFGKICYEEEITQNLPGNLPNNTSSSSNMTIRQIEWQELVP